MSRKGLLGTLLAIAVVACVLSSSMAFFSGRPAVNIGRQPKKASPKAVEKPEKPNKPAPDKPARFESHSPWRPRTIPLLDSWQNARAQGRGSKINPMDEDVSLSERSAWARNESGWQVRVLDEFSGMDYDDNAPNYLNLEEGDVIRAYDGIYRLEKGSGRYREHLFVLELLDPKEERIPRVIPETFTIPFSGASGITRVVVPDSRGRGMSVKLAFLNMVGYSTWVIGSGGSSHWRTKLVRELPRNRANDRTQPHRLIYESVKKPKQKDPEKTWEEFLYERTRLKPDSEGKFVEQLKKVWPKVGTRIRIFDNTGGAPIGRPLALIERRTDKTVGMVSGISMSAGYTDIQIVGEGDFVFFEYHLRGGRSFYSAHRVRKIVLPDPQRHIVGWVDIDREPVEVKELKPGDEKQNEPEPGDAKPTEKPKPKW